MERGFLLEATYRIERGRPVVHLFGVDDAHHSFVVRDTRARPSFFIPARDREKAERILAEIRNPDGFPRVGGRAWRTLEGEPANEIELAVPPDVPPLRERLRDEGIVCHEADVPFVTRYLIDLGVRGAMRLEGPSRPGRRVHRVFQDPAIHPAEWAPELAFLSLDVETDARAAEVRACAFHGRAASGARYAEAHALARPDHAERPAALEEGGIEAACFYHSTERELLGAILSRVRELDPDILTGWNLIGFDLAVLDRACRRWDLPFHLGRADLPVRLRPADENWMTGRASVPGRAALDAMDLVRGAFVRLDDYSLDTAARAILGEGKRIEPENRRGEIERMYREDLVQLLLYNLADARLVFDIVVEMRLLELAVQRVRLTGLPLERGGASIAAFDLLYIGALHREGIVAPSVEQVPPASWWAGRAAGPPTFEPASEIAIGGEVLDSVPGIHPHVWLFDFRSLYPSVILTFNIDPLAHQKAWQEVGASSLADGRSWGAEPGKGERGEAEARGEASPPASMGALGRGRFVRAPNGALFSREEAILPAIIARLLSARREARERDDTTASTAIKILMNSFYGVLATPRCRFHDLRVSNAITTFGQAILHWTRDELEAMGHSVIYGDTDSLFALARVERDGGGMPGADLRRKVEAEGRRVVESLNASLAAWVRREYGVESRLELIFERTFLKLFLPSHRGSSEGSKKRYAGLVETPSGAELVIAGLESVRRDWTPLARNFQRELLRLVLEEQPVEEFVRGFVRDLQEGRKDGELVYRKTLRKPLASYDRTSPPHVKAARMMEGNHGRVIAYVMTRLGPQPVGRITAPLDHEHYLERQIRPIADAVLMHVGKSLDGILGRGDQIGLW
ncbi:MAG: DNA polymerase II [Candidatus Eisenbacteria bacterium]|nr:DNA polymerase II [Candidatus Eisenbacteria bacterium]